MKNLILNFSETKRIFFSNDSLRFSQKTSETSNNKTPEKPTNEKLYALEQEIILGKKIVVETLNENSKLPQSGTHYFSLETSSFSEEQKQKLAELHNKPLIKKWLDEITNSGKELFVIGEAPISGKQKFAAWNHYDIAAAINVGNFQYDAPIQKFLREKYPDRKIPGAIYNDVYGLSLPVVANEIYEQYIGVILQKEFGNRFGPFQAHPAVQVLNLAIDELILRKEKEVNNWENLAIELNKYANFTTKRKNLKLYIDMDDDILTGDENETLRSNKDLQNKISDLLIQKIAEITKTKKEELPLEIFWQDVNKGDELVPMPFFKTR